MSWHRCASLRPDGQRVAKEGDYCHSHRLCVEEIPPIPEPLPQGKLQQISASAWGFCEFCKDAFPHVDLRFDGSKKLACKGRFFQADVLNATAGAGQRCISEWQAEALARLHKIDPDAAIVELLSTGFKPKSYRGILFYVRSEAKA